MAMASKKIKVDYVITSEAGSLEIAVPENFGTLSKKEKREIIVAALADIIPISYSVNKVKK